ncbi:hypothetical protein ACFTAO_24165 [Paenibacillus rhizoplanae]
MNVKDWLPPSATRIKPDGEMVPFNPAVALTGCLVTVELPAAASYS